MNIESFNSARLSFRQPQPTDLDCYEQLYGDSTVTANLGGKQSTQQIVDRLGRHIGHWKEHGFGPWLVHRRDNGDFVGNGGLNYCPEFGDCELEIGYALLPAFWGQGFATEISRILIGIGFKIDGINALVAVTLPSNQASCRVIEKVGFGFVREATVHDHVQRQYRIERQQHLEEG